MKLVVFAHVPPPHHGQSQMVQWLVEDLAKPTEQASPAITSWHVDARLSTGLDDLGAVRLSKVFLLLKYCAQAIRLRLQTGARTLYFVPSPPKRSTVYRDWLVMLLCRPWYRHLVLHWHAVGLGQWLADSARPWEQWLTHRLLSGATLSIVLSDYNRSDAERFSPRQMAVIPNGIPDPCPDYDTRIAPLRRERLEQRKQWLTGPAPDPTARAANTIRVLYLAHCTRDKGLFDAVEGVALANRRLAGERRTARLHLTVAGSFVAAQEQQEFERHLDRLEARGWVTLAGYVKGEEKARLLSEADLFCFPTYFANEGQPLGLIEATAYGLPVVVGRWRAVPELVTPTYPGLVEPRQPAAVAEALLRMASQSGEDLRARYLAHYALGAHLQRMRKTLASLEEAD